MSASLVGFKTTGMWSHRVYMDGRMTRFQVYWPDVNITRSIAPGYSSVATDAEGQRSARRTDARWEIFFSVQLCLRIVWQRDYRGVGFKVFGFGFGADWQDDTDGGREPIRAPIKDTTA